MIPQVFTVVPAVGSTMGEERIKLTGYGFKLPTSEAFAVDGEDWPDAERTVSVQVNGVECPDVLVFSDEEIVCVTPRFLGDAADLPATVNVVVRNLGANGVPITGEIATRVNSFTYQRPSLISESALQYLTRQVAQDMAIHICPNVAICSSPDYSDDPLSGVVAVSELPVLVIGGPTTRKAKFGQEQANETVETSLDNGDVALDAKPLLRDVVFALIVYARSKTEALNMHATAEHYFERQPTMSALASPGGARVEIEWAITDGGRSTDRPADKLFSVEMELVLSGVFLGDVLGTKDDVEVAVSEDTDDALVLASEDLNDD